MISQILTQFIMVIVGAIASGCITYAVTTKRHADSIKEGVLSLLRLMIIQHHDKYIEQGYCSYSDKDIIEKAYTAYHNLGGNGAITTYYNQIMSLPDRKE